MAKFRLISGHHTKGERLWSVTKEKDNKTGETIVHKPVIESRYDLVRMFGREKFERAGDHESVDSGRIAKPVTNYLMDEPEPQAAVATLEPPKAAPRQEIDWADEEEEDSIASELGEDVTYVFGESQSKMLCVFKNKGRYAVANRNDPNVALVESLTKKATRQWIEEYDPDSE